RLTEFYLWMAVGGALGSCFNALLAPVLFSWVVEYPLALSLAAFLLPPLFPSTLTQARNPKSEIRNKSKIRTLKPSLGWVPFSNLEFRAWNLFRIFFARNFGFRILNRGVPIVLGCTVAACFWLSRHQFVEKGQLAHEERTFFGVYRVVRDSEGKSCVLLHGQIWQGMQLQTDERRTRRVPLLYYFPTSPIGQVFFAFHGPQGKARTALVGMGIGNLAGYSESGQEFVFYEIDPGVARIARDPRYFNYLEDAEARGAAIKVVLGDGRLSLQQDRSGRFGMIIVDAFSGDAIPTHLLTREAFQLYLDHLEPDGLLALHITNDHVDLEPIVAELALDQGLVALIQADNRISLEECQRGKAPSTWVIIARQREHLEPLSDSPRWRPLQRRSSPILWRDDYTNLWPILRWD
ncbi:MAG TPA: fused MFS/spermidine synthase, partial [Gemmataceae bacterium]|nr:fused MFS/spermidine synthase [Gemmataceae bacterium]